MIEIIKQHLKKTIFIFSSIIFAIIISAIPNTYLKIDFINYFTKNTNSVNEIKNKEIYSYDFNGFNKGICQKELGLKVPTYTIYKYKRTLLKMPFSKTVNIFNKELNNFYQKLLSNTYKTKQEALNQLKNIIQTTDIKVIKKHLKKSNKIYSFIYERVHILTIYSSFYTKSFNLIDAKNKIKTILSKNPNIKINYLWFQIVDNDINFIDSYLNK